MTDCNATAIINENNVEVQTNSESVVVETKPTEVEVSISEIEIIATIETNEIQVEIQSVGWDTSYFENLFPRNTDYNSLYSEFTRVDWSITRIDYWDNSDKDNLLFSKVLTYTDDKLTQVLTTNEKTTKTMTITIAYDWDDIESVTKILS